MKNIIFDLDGTLALIGSPIRYIANEEMMLHLSTKYILSIVTGSSTAELEEALSVLDSNRNIFPELRCVTANKIPDPKATGKPFLEILKHISGPAVMIGDSDGDEIGSRAAGIPFVRVIPQSEILDYQEELLRAVVGAQKILEQY